MEVIKLIGVLIVIVGFILKLDTLAVVVVAGLATGLVAGMSPMKILETLGTAFITNRTATLFILTLPVIGICERNGLKDKAVDFITSLKNATTGRLIAIWQIIRTLASAFSLRIGGHPQFIRPLINPMAQAAAVVQYGKLDEKTEDDIKGMCAGSENYGNFFAQNCFMGSSGTLLIVSTLTEQGYPVDALQIAGQSVPIAVFAVIVGVIYALIFDQILKRRFSAGRNRRKCNMTWTVSTIVSEIFYCIIGLFFISNGVKALKDPDCSKKHTTALFWFILAFTFIVGAHLPRWITGACVVLMAALTALRLVAPSKSDVPQAAETRKAADKTGYAVFIPPLTLAVTAVLVATFLKVLGANNAIGISGTIALLVALLLFKTKPSYAVTDGTRLVDNVGVTGILPQVLAALGSLFTAAGVGDVIAHGVSAVIPTGNLFAATAVYCVSMALFTMIMGNGFAAFSVITVGIGIPFLIAQGANPVVIGALGLTAGYCGTLMTPMAANFNIVPVALLETKSKYAVIKSQIPVALTMLVIHILLMYFLAF